MSVCLYACMPVCLYACLPVCLSACLPVCLPACLAAWLSVCLSVCMYVYIVTLLYHKINLKTISDPYPINRTLLQLLAGSAGRISLPWSVQLANWDSFGKMVIHRKIDIFDGGSRQCSLLSHVLTTICDTYRVSVEFARWCACYFGPIFSIYILWLGRAMIPQLCSSNLSHRCPVSWPFPQRHPLVELQELNPVTSTEANRRTCALVLKMTPSLSL